jgi:uncharacterized protein YbjT (DUF2867 family)
MKVLLVGAAGFIGRHLSVALARGGHEVVAGVRRPSSPAAIAVDLERDTSSEAWLPRLRGIGAVVNAAGIFREGDRRSFDAVHGAGPRALFSACEAQGVRVVVQVSALGADAEATSRFHLSKRSADDALRASSLDWAIVQPSIVFGLDGRSTRQLALLAALPVVPLPGDGRQRIQPIHVDDLCRLVVRLLEPAQARRITVPAVGPRAVTVREWLETLRGQMGLGRARCVAIPLRLVRLIVGDEAVGMLLRGNTAAPEPASTLLGGPARAIAEFTGQAEADALADRARLDWLLPSLRAAVSLTWIVTGILSLGVYPVADSLSMLARVGLTGALGWAALYGAALLDLAFGVGIYRVRRHRRWLWRAQLALIAGYSVVIALHLPEYWLHPFGPLLKNIPLMAAILLLHEFEPRQWTT